MRAWLPQSATGPVASCRRRQAWHIDFISLSEQLDCKTGRDRQVVARGRSLPYPTASCLAVAHGIISWSPLMWNSARMDSATPVFMSLSYVAEITTSQRQISQSYSCVYSFSSKLLQECLWEIQQQNNHLRPMYKSTFVSRLPWLRTGGFCQSKVFLPMYPGWWQYLNGKKFGKNGRLRHCCTIHLVIWDLMISLPIPCLLIFHKILEVFHIVTDSSGQSKR